MKKVMFVCFILLGINMSAQRGEGEMKERKEMREKMMDLTAQQRAELKTKKMTLHLDLNETQQKKIKNLILERENKRDEMRTQYKEGKELSKDEIFTMRTKKLDDEIAFKKEMKTILNEAQFEKLERRSMHHRGRKKHSEKRIRR